MKRLSLVAGFVISLSLPVLAQPVGGPIELRNPHRRNEIGASGAGVLGEKTTAVPTTVVEGGNSSIVPVVSPPVVMLVDGRYLFVLRGDSLFKFDKKTLKLINSTELPHAAALAPAPGAVQEELRTQSSVPLRPGPNLKVGPRF